MKTQLVLIFASVIVAQSSFAQGQAPVYPSKGQTPQQQQLDEAECGNWAKQQTGVNPEALASQPAQPQQKEVGGPRARHEEREIAGEQQKQGQAQSQQKLKAYNDAKNTCLKGRGYTVGK